MNMTNCKRIYRVIAVAFLILLGVGCSKSPQTAPSSIYAIHNLSQVDGKLYRSSQPTALEFQTLQHYGIQNVIDLRQWHSDASKLDGLAIKHYKFPLNASKVTYEDLVKIVATIDALDGKTLVHCLHGSDRTGVVVAAYRIGVEDWEKQRAVEEFTKEGFGYHEFWFPNLKKLLLSLDEKKFRNDIQNYKKQLKEQ